MCFFKLGGWSVAQAATGEQSRQKFRPALKSRKSDERRRHLIIYRPAEAGSLFIGMKLLQIFISLLDMRKVNYGVPA